MKKKFLAFFMVTVLVMGFVPAFQVTATHTWQQAYADFLRTPENLITQIHRDEINFEQFRRDYFFALRDLTNDGIPELLVFSEGPYTASGMDIQVYTFDRNTVVLLDTIDGYMGSGFSISDNPDFPGIFSVSSRMVGTIFGYHDIVNGQAHSEWFEIIDHDFEYAFRARRYQTDNPIYNEWWESSATFLFHEINETNIQSVIFDGQTPAETPAANNVTVIINGTVQNFEVSPQIIDGRTMLPFRAIGEALGMTVGFDSATNAATLTAPGLNISHVTRTAEITINGAVRTFDAPSVVTAEGRTLVPVRMIAEATGATVEWDGTTRTVTITT